MKCNTFSVLLTVIFEVHVFQLTVSETATQVARPKRSDDGGPLQVVVDRLSQQVTTLEAKVSALGAKTNTLDNTVAFYALSQAKPLQALPNGPLIFNHMVTNIGNAYDPSTGFFTVPISGLYEFQATVMQYSTTGAVSSGLYVDNQRLAIAVADNRHGANYHQSTIRIIVHVSAGSKVAVKNDSSSVSNFYGSVSEPYSSFSGFLMKAD